LLIQPPQVKAIFANNDEMAAGVLKVAHEMGITVPDELSVTGFDFGNSCATSRAPIRKNDKNAAFYTKEAVLRGWVFNNIPNDIK